MALTTPQPLIKNDFVLLLNKNITRQLCIVCGIRKFEPEYYFL